MKTNLIISATIGLLAIYFVSCTNGTKELHEVLRRSLSKRADVCEDSPQCTQDLCAQDAEIANILCPVTCGRCVSKRTTTEDPNCKDQVIGITCAALPEDPCQDELGVIACPKYCGQCPTVSTTASPTTAAPTPTTSTTTTTTTTTSTTTTTTTTTPMPTTTQAPPATTASATVPSGSGPCALQPCLNGGTCTPSGNIFTCSCPQGFGGAVCHIKDQPSTTAATTTPVPKTTKGPTTPRPTNSANCPATYLTNKDNIGCHPAEIVYMIEYSAYDASWWNYNVDAEGDYIKAMIDRFDVSNDMIRIGVVIYHDTVREVIHIDDTTSKSQLKDRISRITRGLQPSGNADLAKAFDYVRTHSFTKARPNAEKVVVPIIHQMHSPEQDDIPEAAQKLKDECTIIYGLTVYSSNLDTSILRPAMTQPYQDYYRSFQSFRELETHPTQLGDLKCNK